MFMFPLKNLARKELSNYIHYFLWDVMTQTPDIFSLVDAAWKYPK